MPKTKYFDIAAFPITGPAVYQALVTKYVIILVYTISTVIFGLPAMTQAAGHLYGLFFPVALTATAGLALTGVIRSRHTGKIRVEYWGTLFLLAGFAGYSVAIVWRALSEPDRLDTLPAALLPVILSVFPFFRLRNILKPGGGARPTTGEVAVHGGS